MPPSLPEAIGKYTIDRFIESGGMGDVYLARDPALDRAVAIKFLREGFDNQEMRERFEREARAAGRLSHPNIVTIYEFGIFDGRPFIAMEFVRGEPLSKLIRRRESIPLVRKLEMMEGLCSGLAHAHKTGMVHRDIKPANLMVDNDGGPLKILDFGIVRMAGSGLTSHGVLVGTINYMSPEQITGRGTIDLRSDVFAVGAVLHEVFTYQRAFPGEMTDVLYKIVHAQPESAATLSPGLDAGIVRAIDQCLEKAPERRYQDLGVLRRELARIRQRLELDDTDTYGHTALTLRQPKDPASFPSRPSGAHRTPVSGTPAPSTPPSAPSGPSAPSVPPSLPQTPGSDRARRAAEAAADLARAQRAAEEARLELEREAEEQARLEAERLEQERQEQERAERARLARERAQAEQARLERQQAERVRAEQARAEQARLEQAQQEQARLEQARLDKARAEEAERARVERERLEQARLEEARRAREQAEKERAEAHRKAEADAKRQAEARREQRQRDLARAQEDVAAGRFAEAAGLLRPWAAESAGDAAFAQALKQAEAGVARIEGERRAQEELNRQIGSASELVVRQDFAGASRLVQAILAAHPTHPAAKNLEREIARGEEQRAKAASAVERARALFDDRPGEAMELLERFTPAHGLVDSALAEMRERHAARERERLRLEKQAQRQQQIAAVTAQAGALARNRAVQGGAAALLLLIVLIASWSSIFPPKPIEPAAVDTGTPASGAATPGGQPAGADSGATPANVPPAGGDVPKETSTVDAGAATAPKTPGTGIPGVPPGTNPATTNPKTSGQPTPNGRTQGQTPTGGQQPSALGPATWPSRRRPAPPRSPIPRLTTAGGPIRRPRRPATPRKVTVPRRHRSGGDRRSGDQPLDRRVHGRLPDAGPGAGALDEPGLDVPRRAVQAGVRHLLERGHSRARGRSDGRAEGRRAVSGTSSAAAISPPTPAQHVEWPMRKTPNGWVANP